ncbi:hypothetical protein CYMTET_5271 [Cymbomonas tetramitiformis]|uniref:Uncharacterized protein n=1 Tax=Cymbomonas tetramitiformis TaxID=36881 RepID=A0AAE0LJM7_9CHLO|nr:hypothetical protein CYMTET_5271 [Cymbomonas tetramitiformis]
MVYATGKISGVRRFSQDRSSRLLLSPCAALVPPRIALTCGALASLLSESVSQDVMQVLLLYVHLWSGQHSPVEVAVSDAERMIEATLKKWMKRDFRFEASGALGTLMALGLGFTHVDDNNVVYARVSNLEETMEAIDMYSADRHSRVRWVPKLSDNKLHAAMRTDGYD